jgi:hypothetical protein
MVRLRIMAVFALTALGGVGCGTVHNLDGNPMPIRGGPGDVRPTPFGGVFNDLKWSVGALLGAPTLVPFFLADVPLSLVGDAVTLPWAIRAWCDTEKEWAWERKAREAKQAGQEKSQSPTERDESTHPPPLPLP